MAATISQLQQKVRNVCERRREKIEKAARETVMLLPAEKRIVVCRIQMFPLQLKRSRSKLSVHVRVRCRQPQSCVVVSAVVSKVVSAVVLRLSFSESCGSFSASCRRTTD